MGIVNTLTAENTTLLAGNATFNGATIDVAGSVQGASRLRAFAYSDVAGTLNIQQSRDGSTWRTTISQAVGATSGTVVESIISRRYIRASYTNGAGAQGTFELDTCLVSV
jgi:hypothetical protein